MLTIAEKVLKNLNELSKRQERLQAVIDNNSSEDKREEARGELVGTQDWWNECIDVVGYDQETTEWVDQFRTNEIAFFSDGSYIRHNSNGWKAFLCEDKEEIGNDTHTAIWLQNMLAPHWDRHAEFEFTARLVDDDKRVLTSIRAYILMDTDSIEIRWIHPLTGEQQNLLRNCFSGWTEQSTKNDLLWEELLEAIEDDEELEAWIGEENETREYPHNPDFVPEE